MAVTTDPQQLPAKSTWYVETNLPAPHSSPASRSPLEPADLAEVVRLYGLRGWVEQSYKQCKTELRWADAMVHADVALRRHWLLLFCAFPFCWLQWLQSMQDKQGHEASPPGGGKKGTWSVGHLAAIGTPGARLAHAVGAVAAVVAGVDSWPATGRTAAAITLGR